MSKSKLWGGAFSEESNDLAWAFGQSIASDAVLWREELDVSIAHAEMLGATGIIDDAGPLVAALREMRADRNWLSRHTNAEDIHAAVEAELSGRIGEDAMRLTTARSRNDQIAAVSRLWVMRRCDDLQGSIRKIQEALVKLGDKHASNPMPGTTHMQPAQPVTLGFHLLAYFWMLNRDKVRVGDARATAAGYCPLGSGSLAGTSLPIDCEMTANALGFEKTSENALDAVSDRDFIGDMLHACSTLMQHLSRLSHELVLWSTAGYGYVRIGDAFSTGSSLMPQKRNPDMAELIRGRSAKCIGNWTTFMSMMRAQPLSYNRDMQDDKPPLFESVNLCLDSLGVMDGMLQSATFNTERMREMAAAGSSTATAVAEFFVKQGVAFRTAHGEAGRIVLECEQRGWKLADLVESQLNELTERGSSELLKWLSVEGNLESKVSAGSPSPGEIKKQLASARRALG